MKRLIYLIAIKIITIITIIIIIININLLACNRSNNVRSGVEDIMTKATEERFSVLEIREYKGIKLDSSIGPRDNSISGIQSVDIDNYVLEVSGIVNNPYKMSYDEVLALNNYEKLITLYCVEGWDATILWKGVYIKDIIALAEADEKADTVIFHCIDGYTTSLPLQVIIDKNIMLAYSSNGIKLPDSLGYPFIVVAEDKLGYKWARWVNKIEISSDTTYKGFWERRGYDNKADVP